MSPPERAERREYQKLYMRRRRATAKSASGSPAETSEPATAPVTSAAPHNAPQTKSAKSGKPLKAQDLDSFADLHPLKAQSLQRLWRAEASEYLLEAITRKESPFSGAGLRSAKMLALFFGLGEKLTRITDEGNATDDYLFAVMLECLERLIGRKPIGGMPKIG